MAIARVDYVRRAMRCTSDREYCAPVCYQMGRWREQLVGLHGSVCDAHVGEKAKGGY
jgi:hypothetical protein